ncbi:hypothetical protein MHB43_22235 [Paenibacillus sp. FSL H8-0317]|uniref:hypothetical protein n=1 Tax=Paenibacillus sp. FSL H8-0317 TaxID=2921385 RepID=UPI00324BE997
MLIRNVVQPRHPTVTVAASLEATWSPEQITERFHADGLPVVSLKPSIAGSSQNVWFRCALQVLRHKGKRRKSAEARGKFTIDRKKSTPVKRLGTGKSKGCVAAFIERKTRLYIAVLMPDRTALSMEIALSAAISQYPKGTFLTANLLNLRRPVRALNC